MRIFLLLTTLVALPPWEGSFQAPHETPVEVRRGSQHLVKHCLRGSAGIWRTEEVIDYCLSLVEAHD